MLRINNYTMNLDLTKVGVVRQGHIYCPDCGKQHVEPADFRKRNADVLYKGEATHQNCESCGAALVPQA